MDLLARFGTDELAVVRFAMKLMSCWPENKSWWKDIISFLYPLPCMIFSFFVWWFCIFDSWKEGMTTVLQSASDCLGTTTFTVRAIAVRRHAQEIYNIQKMISDDFGPLERKVGKIRIQRPLLFWLPCILFAFQCVVSIVVSCLTMLEPPERREPSLRIPDWMIYNDARFFTLTTFFCFVHVPVYFANTAAEALIITLSNLVCEKAATLRKMLRQLNKIDDYSELEANLDNAIRYHTLLGDLRNRTESICGGSMLFQLFFILISLGSPGLRIVLDELKTEIMGFMACYVAWVSSQLIIYCELFDQATRESNTIEFTAYSVYDPSMPNSIARKLIMMISRASRPLHFTANGYIKVNRRTLMLIYKQSYRFYSAVLNLR